MTSNPRAKTMIDGDEPASPKASSDLLEALKLIAGPPEVRHPLLPPKHIPRWSAEQCRDIARAAIAKAEGRSQ